MGGIESLAEHVAKKKQEKTQTEVLLEIASTAQLFHDANGRSFARMRVTGHHEVWPVLSSGFRRWLAHKFFGRTGKSASSAVFQEALQVVDARAQFEGGLCETHLRVAEAPHGIALDLCNSDWAAVHVTADGWDVVTDPPVAFRRARGMAALTEPVRGGSIDELRPFVNVADDASWQLLVSWLLAALRPSGPYPVLILTGEQGAAKSTTARVLRALVDPSTVSLRTAPREERDLMIAASNAHVLSLDNLSGLPHWLADGICRLATGGGFATRTLFTDDEELLVQATRPVILNGIDETTSRQDLVDRSIILTLPSIRDEKRQDEAGFWPRFEAARPRILGALLDATCEGLRNIETVTLTKTPRMADFAKWIVACEPALPWPSGSFMAAYTGNRAGAIEAALESDAVASAVRAFAAVHPAWEGTASELLTHLAEHATEATRRTKAWPTDARSLSNRLRRAATFLRTTGLDLSFERHQKGKRVIRLSREISVTSVTCVTELDAASTFGVTQNSQVTQNSVTQKSASPAKASNFNAVDDGDAGDAKIRAFANGRSDAGEWEVF